jgi:hypothetical protein
MDQVIEIAGRRVLDCGDGPVVETEQQGRDLVGAALIQRCDWALVPIARLAPDFFRLATGLAGEVVQKFANYDIGLAVMGDIGACLEKSAPLRDFVHEANRGGRLWFLPDRTAFEQKIAS